MSTPPRPSRSRGRRPGGSVRAALGILVSRMTGLLREVAFAGVFGVGAFGDVLTAAFRAPNLLQNLLGEQTMSAAMIPIYGRLLESGRERDAGRFAGAVFGLLLAVAAGLALAGAVAARPIAALFTPGFLADAASGAPPGGVDRFELLVVVLRIVFPMSGILVLSAWTVAVLNTHRRFFLPYMAPAVWNGAIVAALLGGAATLLPGGLLGLGEELATGTGRALVVITCVGALVGGLLQFLFQLPAALRLERHLRPRLDWRAEGVPEARRAFGPMVLARGASQLSSYADQVLASLLVAGALSALRWAGLLYLLPFSLFAMSVAAAELPELARGEHAPAAIAARVRRALGQSGFMVLPTALGYLAFGWLVVGAVYARGRFEPADQWLVYLVLGAYSLGLPASTWSRLLQNVFYAAGDTRTPARIALLRLAVSAGLGAALMLPLDRLGLAELVGIDSGDRDLRLGACGLALASAVAAWSELAVLRRFAVGRLPDLRLPWREAAVLAGLALAAALPAAALALATDGWPGLPRGLAVVVGYAGVYLALARWRRRPELAAWVGRLAGGQGEEES